jgi:hypothetical protein
MCKELRIHPPRRPFVPHALRMLAPAWTGLALACLLAGAGVAQERTTPPGRGAGGPPQGRAREGFPDLVSGLKAIPGCLGVETARTSSGKQVIFAWFADKAAAVRWYNSDIHRQAQKRFFPDRPSHVPLAFVPDSTGPILAIASLTWADSAQIKAGSMPVSQIAIELYQPLPGGVFVGGRFAPDSMKVRGMLDYTPPSASR